MERDWPAYQTGGKHVGNEEGCVEAMRYVAGYVEGAEGGLGVEYADVEGENGGADEEDGDAPGNNADEEGLAHC